MDAHRTVVDGAEAYKMATAMKSAKEKEKAVLDLAPRREAYALFMLATQTTDGDALFDIRFKIMYQVFMWCKLRETPKSRVRKRVPIYFPYKCMGSHGIPMGGHFCVHHPRVPMGNTATT